MMQKLPMQQNDQLIAIAFRAYWIVKDDAGVETDKYTLGSICILYNICAFWNALFLTRICK